MEALHGFVAVQEALMFPGMQCIPTWIKEVLLVSFHQGHQSSRIHFYVLAALLGDFFLLDIL